MALVTGLLAGSIGGCAVSDNREATSLLGEPLFPMALTPEELADREAALAEARAAFDADPGAEDSFIWLGRRTAYLGFYREAIHIYADGLEIYPDSYKLRRHRGHRYISIRRFDKAIEDLNLASLLVEGVPDAPEPDGMPNALNIPTSTNYTNIYYHLGLAHYVEGDFEDALDAYRRCLGYSTNPDMLCATTYWLYLTLRRLGRDEAAEETLIAITADMDVIENEGYQDLLLMFKGDFNPKMLLPDGAAEVDDATVAYGVGMWHLLTGDRNRANEIFREVVNGAAWPAFGHIAAEAELAR